MSVVVEQQRVRLRERGRRSIGALRQVPVDRILLGGWGRVGATDFARAIDDPLWPSRTVLSGPHARLLRASAVRDLDDRDILASDYGRYARRCQAITGRFHGAVDEAGIVEVARDYLRRNSSNTSNSSSSNSSSGGDNRAPSGPIFPRPRESGASTPIRLAPIQGSDCFQVIDGHHRAAAYAVSGVASLPARVSRASVTTPLQSLLHRMSWNGRADVLYQPVESPELATWAPVRRCADRLDKMDLLLGSQGIGPGRTSYLDVGSCYGWFVSQMSRFGYRSEGVDPDPRAAEVGAWAYGLDPVQVHSRGVVGFLDEASAAGTSWDVVSSFSLLHHFVLGRGEISAQQLVEMLDEVTDSVLFLDTGQAHEKWFHRSLAGWDSARVRGFLEEHTTFDEVVDLGPDLDDRPPYSGNHARHLFACLRSS